MSSLSRSKLERKWSKQILGYGFTAVPNLLLMFRSDIGLTSTECLVVIAIESFRWDDANPYPGLETLSKRSGYSPRTLSRTVTSLEDKGVIRRIRRSGTSNSYDMEPLIVWLEYLLEQQVPALRVKADRTSTNETGSRPVTALSPKEYLLNNTKVRRKDSNNVVLEGEVMPYDSVDTTND